MPSFGNIAAFAVDEALVLVDTGNGPFATHNHAKVRAWTDLPLDTAVYTHGHIDHVLGLAVRGRGPRRRRPPPRGGTPSGSALRPLRATAGYNGVNARQFKMPGFGGRPTTATPTSPTTRR